MPHPNSNPDADAIYARISLSLAKSQRLFSSLSHDNTDPAPASINPKSTNPKTTSNVDPDANLEPEPPLIPDSLPGLLGIGATPPSPNSGATDKTSSASDVLLRRQLLGKDWARKAKVEKNGKGQGDGNGGGGRATIYPKSIKGRGGKMGVGARKGSESDEEEEEEGEKGRSSLGGVRMKMKMKWGGVGGGGVGGKEARDGDGDEGAREARGKGVKRGGNYLDEVLAERVERKKKRKKGGDKKGGKGREDGSITN